MRLEQWTVFQPDRATGTLRVDFTRLITPQRKICWLFVFALSLTHWTGERRFGHWTVHYQIKSWLGLQYHLADPLLTFSKFFYFYWTSFQFQVIIKILNLYIILLMYSLVSLLSYFYPLPAMHSLLVTFYVTKYLIGIVVSIEFSPLISIDQ